MRHSAVRELCHPKHASVFLVFGGVLLYLKMMIMKRVQIVNFVVFVFLVLVCSHFGLLMEYVFVAKIICAGKYVTIINAFKTIDNPLVLLSTHMR